jgi:PAS domain S-box-containing protein
MDIEDHSQNQNIEAKIERQRLTTLINSMADGVVALDQEGTIVAYNGAALNILDVNKTLSNEKLDSLVTIYSGEEPIDYNNEIYSRHKIFSTRDWKLKYKDGSLVNLYVSLAPVRLGFGSHVKREGVVMIFRDITREKSLEEERDEFISVVSHELRTPVAIAEGTLGNAQFLYDKKGLDCVEIKESIDRAHEQVNFLANLINDLSTLSRAERNKLKTSVEEVDANQLIEELEKSYKPEAEKKGLILNIDKHNEPLKIHTTKLYLTEILQNFVSNSIKYTEHGFVKIQVRPTDDLAKVEFIVTDSGIGISKQDQEKIFEKFYRSEDYRTRENSGTGLGLYVTQKLATIIGAKISVTSELNRGSIFTITVPNLS